MKTPLFIHGQENELLDFIESKNYSQLIFLVDANTNGYCLPKLLDLFPSWRTHQRIIIPKGETNKTLATCDLIWDALAMAESNKSTLLLNIGGGMLSDIGGFAASVYKRGIDILNIPTTLLAMTDAAYGGKNGIDYHHIKNQLGNFHHPIALYILPQFLNTLDTRILHSGIAESIKHALISDAIWWNELPRYSLDDFSSIAAVTRSLQCKMHLVQQDEKDISIRQTLNFGHSIGHAIESYSLQTAYPLFHGEAIMLGMLYEAKLSQQLLGLDKLIYLQLVQLQQAFFPVLQLQFSWQQLQPYLIQDKKNNTGIRMSLLKAPGECLTQIAVSEQLIQAILA